MSLSDKIIELNNGCGCCGKKDIYCDEWGTCDALPIECVKEAVRLLKENINNARIEVKLKFDGHLSQTMVEDEINKIFGDKLTNGE